MQSAQGKPNPVWRVREKFLEEVRSHLRLDNEQKLDSLEGWVWEGLGQRDGHVQRPRGKNKKASFLWHWKKFSRVSERRGWNRGWRSEQGQIPTGPLNHTLWWWQTISLAGVWTRAGGVKMGTVSGWTPLTTVAIFLLPRAFSLQSRFWSKKLVSRSAFCKIAMLGEKNDLISLAKVISLPHLWSLLWFR